MKAPLRRAAMFDGEASGEGAAEASVEGAVKARSGVRRRGVQQHADEASCECAAETRSEVPR